MRILCLADSPAWAFSHRARAFERYAPAGWHVVAGWPGAEHLDQKFDAVFLLDCTANAEAYWPLKMVAKLVGSHCWLHDANPSDWRTRGVNANRCRAELARTLADADVVAVYNRAQAEVVAEHTAAPVVLAPYTPDTDIFRPSGREAGEKLVVGWAAQVNGGLNSFKGLTDCLIPAIANVGLQVEWRVITPDAHTAMTQQEMAWWMADLDVFLVCSSGEGGPQGPFEAAACGAAVISTDVGQVSDWGCLRSHGMIVPSYGNVHEARQTAAEIAERIRQLHRNRGLLEKVRRDLCRDVQENWSAKRQCPLQLKAIWDAMEKR